MTVTESDTTRASYLSEIQELVEEKMRSLSGRILVDADEVIDLCLDIRSLAVAAS